MSTSRSGRQAPPPVVDNNPPRPPRAPGADVSVQLPDAPRPDVTATVTNPGTNVGNSVPSVPGPVSYDALMYGRVNPEDDRAQTGVRLPRYLTDAVRMVAATSRGKASMQDIVTAAVRAYLPTEVVERAWVLHGGQPSTEQD